MTSAELASTQAPPEPAAGLRATRAHRPRNLADHPANFGAPVHPETSGREASAPPPTDRRRGPAAARWLRRALADSARAWALAAGVPPDLYH